MEGIRQYSDLPSNILEYLGDFDAFNFAVALVKKYGVGDRSKNTSDVLAIIDQVAIGEIVVADIPKRFEVILGTDELVSKQAAIELVGNKILPFASILDIDAESAIRSWGADPAQFASVPRVQAEKPVEDPEPTVVHEALEDKDAVFSDPIMQHRLELIVASYRDGVRTKEQAKAVLMRTIKTGGLEMSEGEAGEVLEIAGVTKHELATDPTDGLRIATDGFVTASEAKQSLDGIASPSARNDEEGSGSAPGAEVDDFSDDDAAEVAKIATAKQAAMEVPALITDTKAAADRIAVEAKLTFPSGEVRTRFDHIIDARLRDVRDGFGTREKLEASVESGGVGMSGVSLVAAMEMVENMDAMHHLALGAKTDFLKEKIRLDRSDRLDRKEDERAQEAQVMSQRYAEITGKVPDAHVEPSTAARASIAIPAAQATEQRAQSIDTSKVRAAIEAAKSPSATVTPVMSAATIPTTATGRPIVEDIRFERKLAGPVEELRMLTLSDFRRLSSDPKQAILRVRDKVELAAQEGYEHRIAAIKAWRESPLSQMYVTVSREALMGGKSIVDVLAEKRSRGEDALREDELHSIVELNGVLRF